MSWKYEMFLGLSTILKMEHFFVFNLTSSHTSMQLQGEEEFFFEEPGVGALFDSAVVHKTVKADDKTLKLAVFMYDPDECV